ncbi:MAG: hypothetical protein WAM14_21730 [Candidatus Nitrosopolaris sp.]
MLDTVLFLSTYQSLDAKGKHGLLLGDNTFLTVQKNGAFQRFHNRYICNPSMYLNACQFSWSDLINEKTGRICSCYKHEQLQCCERKSKNELHLEHELHYFTYAIVRDIKYNIGIS